VAQNIIKRFMSAEEVTAKAKRVLKEALKNGFQE
jgi:cytosine/adenosine deaminase-related metal-dependent hydrolase